MIREIKEILFRDIYFFSIRMKQYVALLLIMLAYYLMVSQYIESWDDVMYQFYHIEKNGYRDIVWNHPISSFIDAVNSQIIDYKLFNGRFITHTIIQLLCGTPIGKFLFPLIVTLFWGLFIVGIQYLVKIITGKNLGYTPIAILSLLLIVSPGKTFLGSVSFAVNYVLGSTSMIWCLCIILSDNLHRHINKITFSITCLFFLFSGTLHEGFSIPMAAFMTVWIILKKGKISKSLWILIACYYVGAIFEITAPANFHRLTVNETDRSLIRKVLSATSALLRSHFQVLLLIIITIWLWITRKKSPNKLTIVWPFIFIALISLLFDIVIAFMGPHQLIPICVMEIAIFSILYTQTRFYNEFKYRGIIQSVSVLVLTAFFCIILNVRVDYKRAWDKFIDETRESNSTFANAENLYQINDRYCKLLLYFSPEEEINRYITWGKTYSVALSALATNGENPYLISLVLPKSIDDLNKLIKPDCEFSDDIYSTGQFVVVRQDKNKTRNNLIYELKPTIYDLLKQKIGIDCHLTETIQLKDIDCFIDSTFMYSIIYIDPQSIQTIQLCN